MFSLFFVDTKDEYSSLAASNSDERVEDMDTENAGSNQNFGSTKGYFIKILKQKIIIF